MVDDSGLVVICPKDKVDSIFIDYAKYVAVVGSGQYLATKPKGLDDVQKELTEIEVIAKLRRGRGDDTVLVVGMSIAEHFSTGNHVVQVCQEKLQDGIRGDPASNPFDRRAPRRLIHCDAIAVSSLTCDDAAEVESICLPDDIVVLAERRNNHEFVDGSFLGRAELLENPYTNAYREINGAADGFPGWNVDRYDKWLLVQHDDQYPRGPLPSNPRWQHSWCLLSASGSQPQHDGTSGSPSNTARRPTRSRLCSNPREWSNLPSSPRQGPLHWYFSRSTATTSMADSELQFGYSSVELLLALWGLYRCRGVGWCFYRQP